MVKKSLFNVPSAYTYYLGIMFYGLVKQINAKTTIEIGIKNGYTSLWLAYAMKESGGVHYAIDIDSKQITNFKKLLKKHGYQDACKTICKDSKNVKWDKDIDFIFIDSEHSYDTVSGEIITFSLLVRKDGILAIHDYNIPEVKEACDKFLPCKEWDKIIVQDNYKTSIITGCGTLICTKRKE